jgi:hypothetical protein
MWRKGIGFVMSSSGGMISSCNTESCQARPSDDRHDATHREHIPRLPHRFPLRHRRQAVRTIRQNDTKFFEPRRVGRKRDRGLLEEVDRVETTTVAPALNETKSGRVEEVESFGLGVLVRDLDVEEPASARDEHSRQRVGEGSARTRPS